MNSFNHYAYGAVGDWMYRNVAGLELDPEDPGYRHIIFAPRPGGTITSAQASLVTPGGPTEISWKIEGETLAVELLIPEGARGSFMTPDGYISTKPVEYGAGRHRVELTKGGTEIAGTLP